MEKARYLIHEKCGTLELLRGTEISGRITKKYPISSQIAILFDKDEKPNEYSDYQAFRKECKSRVDREFQKIKEAL